MSEKNFYPEITPYYVGHLRVSDAHEIYFEEAGNPKGQPVIILHGGPGGRINHKTFQFFDPQFFRIIAFDQRGCGKSRPFCSIEQNSTWDLVADIEKIREHLGIQTWFISGGSWGSTLALTYAIQFPEKVRALHLRGIFLCRKNEVDWLFEKGASEIFPEQWQQFLEPIRGHHCQSNIEAYFPLLTSHDEQIRLQAAQAWSKWEDRIATLITATGSQDDLNSLSEALPMSLLECHYFINRGFYSEDNWIIKNSARICQIPIFITHGRYDMVCPVSSAVDLAKALPHADLQIVNLGGHSPFEDEMAKIMRRNADLLRSL